MAGGWFGILLEKRLNELPGCRAFRYYKISTGLSGLHSYNWYKQTDDYLQKHSPDVLITFFGANDGLAVKTRKNRLKSRYPRKFYHARKQKYKELYSFYVYEYMLHNHTRFQKIFWLGQPATSHPELRHKYPLINEIYAREAQKFLNVHYIPSWKLTSGPKGEFLEYMADRTGRKHRVKWPDKVHQTKPGGEIFLEKIWPYIQKEIDFSQKKTTPKDLPKD